MKLTPYGQFNGRGVAVPAETGDPMSASNNKKRSWMIDLILIVLIIGLGYLVYTLIWGDWNGVISRLGSGDISNIFDSITGNVGAIGKGIRDSFGRMAP
jgi:hypothetical protein